MKMKALCIKQPFASQIYHGIKTLEIRTWKSHYRGDFVLCASANPIIEADPGKFLPTAKALAVVEIVGCRPMTKKDEKAAHAKGGISSDLFVFELENVRPIERFPVKGRLNFFDLEVDAITYIKAKDMKKYDYLTLEKIK